MPVFRLRKVPYVELVVSMGLTLFVYALFKFGPRIGPVGSDASFWGAIGALLLAMGIVIAWRLRESRALSREWHKACAGAGLQPIDPDDVGEFDTYEGRVGGHEVSVSWWPDRFSIDMEGEPKPDWSSLPGLRDARSVTYDDGALSVEMDMERLSADELTRCLHAMASVLR